MTRIVTLPVLSSLAMFTAFAIRRTVLLWGMWWRLLPLMRLRFRRLRGRFGAHVFDDLFKFTAIEPNAPT